MGLKPLAMGALLPGGEALSSTEEKLERATCRPGPARATLKQLRAQWVVLTHLEYGAHVELTRMDGRRECWRYVGGKGEDAVYEMEST